MKYEFILNHLVDAKVAAWCRALNVSGSGYYAWLKRPMSQRALNNQQLDQKITETFARHKSRYGSPRITEELNSDGKVASQNRVARRMRLLKLKAKQAKNSR